MNTTEDSGRSMRGRLPAMLLDVLPLAMRVMSAEMRDTRHGLSNAHLPVLAILEQASRTQRELADIMSVRAATMSNTLTTLEERGWVIRERTHEDRRLVMIALTQTGRLVLNESKAEMEAFLSHLLRHLDEREQMILAEGLTVLQGVFAAALSEQAATSANE